MSIFIAVYVGVVAALLVGFVGVSFALSRGRRLRCPDCGSVFSAPFFDEKISGIGYTFPYMGQVKCPSCGTKHARREYVKEEA